MATPPDNPNNIRRATADDLDSLTPLFDAYRVFYKQPSDPDAARAFLSDRISRDESVVFLAIANGVPAGFAQLYPAFSSVRLGTDWVLNDLFVAPPNRGFGVGRALTVRCMDHAQETGALSLELLTEVTNTPAQALYESLGWKRTTDYYRYTFRVPNP